jgi:hypothetical protein
MARFIFRGRPTLATGSRHNRSDSIVAKPEPVAAVTTSEVIFSDSFDGEDLSKRWEIKNEDKEGYLFEKGSLLLTTSVEGKLDGGNMRNLLSVTDVDLEGDWDMSAQIRPEFATGEDWFQIGLLINFLRSV